MSPAGIDRRTFLRGGLAAAASALATTTLVGRAQRPVIDLGGVRLAAASAPPPIITRAGWGADESLRSGTPSFATIRKLIVHHTGDGVDKPDRAQWVRDIYRFHTLGNGWSDIGYNFLIDPEGRVYEGRWARDYAAGELHSGENAAGQGVIGAHALNHNTGSVGVALLGTFSSTQPTAAAIESLIQLLAWKAERHGIDPMGSDPYTNAAGATVVFPNVAGHRDVRATSCPGTLYDMLPGLRHQVALRISHGLIGYRIVATDGSVAHFGGAADYGDPQRLGIPVVAVAMAGVPDGQGFWVLDEAGGIFALGGAQYFGSVPALRAAGHHIGPARIVALAPTPAGDGYWVADDVGGVFAFGAARFFGSVPALRAAGHPIGPARIVAIAATPSGGGYWEADDVGGVFAFGDAGFYGSIPALRQAGHPIGPAQIVALAATPSGRGYWELDEVGGVFAFGDAGYHGSLPQIGVRGDPARRIAATPTGGGYLILTGSGAVYAFGDAPFYGRRVGAPAVDLAPVVRR